MAFGFLVRTTAGVISMQEMRSARVVRSEQVSGTSGSFFVTGFNANDGHIFVRPLNGVGDPAFVYDNDTSELNWEAGFSNATEFLFLFIKIR